MLRRYRIWRDTRWFMKHWVVGRKFARMLAIQKEARRGW